MILTERIVANVPIEFPDHLGFIKHAKIIVHFLYLKTNEPFDITMTKSGNCTDSRGGKVSLLEELQRCSTCGDLLFKKVQMRLIG